MICDRIVGNFSYLDTQQLCGAVHVKHGRFMLVSLSLLDLITIGLSFEDTTSGATA